MEADDQPRPVLDGAAVLNAIGRPGGLWRAIEVTSLTGSTNADLLARAAAGAAEGLVLAAEEQRAGRGRKGRAWVSPPGAGLMFSMLVRPDDVPSARRGWLALLAGLAVADAVRAVAGADTRLKWPNDVLAGEAKSEAKSEATDEAKSEATDEAESEATDEAESQAKGEAKLAGILAEAADGAVVIGIGVNVSTSRDELPPPGPGSLAATSLRVLGARTDRAALLAGILAGFERRYAAWRRAAGDPEASGLRAEYAAACGTLGRQVRVELAGGQLLSGLAVGVDPDGRLLVRGPGESEVPVAAGDVVHLR
jgi:BirA family biotin operon repressor/biotin-[acetyl-CoA-carboxylase] ligase